MNILYVEDDALDVDLTLRELGRSAPQHHVESAGSLNEARALLNRDQEKPYDLVMVDLNLPDGFGVELLSEIRAKGYPTAVVMVTGQGDQETAAAVLKSGAEDYIVKAQDYLKYLPATLENAYQRFHNERVRRSRPLRVLYIDPNYESVDQIRRHLTRYAPHIQIQPVSSSAEAFDCLPDCDPVAGIDAIVTDNRLPDSSALDFLKEILQVRGLSIPVLVVTGRGSEEIATQTLKLGAADYLVKNPGYLYQLPSMIEHAISRTQLAHEQAALRESEARFRRLAENAPDWIFRIVLKPVRHYDYVSPVALRFLGYSPEEFYNDPDQGLKLMHPQDRAAYQKLLDGRMPPGKPVVLRMIHKDGRLIWAEHRLTYVHHPNGELLAIEGIARDVTGQREVEAEMQRQLQRFASLRSIDQAISNSFDLNLVMVVLIDKVTSELKVDAAMILMYNPVNQMLEYSAGSGFSSRLVHDFGVRIGEAFAGLAMYDRRVIQFPAPDLPPPSRDTARLMTEEGFVSGLCSPLITKGEVKGVLQIFSKTQLSVEESWMGFLEVLSSQAAIAIDNAALFERLQRTNQDLRIAYDATLEGWVRTMELRDKEIRGHNQRVTEMALDLAEYLHVNPEELSNIRRGALLHDIGKMGIPDAILLKPGPLSEDEWKIMRQHPRFAFELLAPIPYLDRALEIPYCHHEHWDGSGYPRGLKGDNIPFSARLFAVVDVWDILCSKQVYRPAWPRDRALEFIREQAGLKFDPAVVIAFLSLLA